jgi:hypothetical protein
MDVREWIRFRVYCIVASKLVMCICDEWMDDDFDGHRGFQNLGNMARKSKVKMLWKTNSEFVKKNDSRKKISETRRKSLSGKYKAKK